MNLSHAKHVWEQTTGVAGRSGAQRGDAWQGGRAEQGGAGQRGAGRDPGGSISEETANIGFYL